MEGALALEEFRESLIGVPKIFDNTCSDKTPNFKFLMHTLGSRA